MLGPTPSGPQLKLNASLGEPPGERLWRVAFEDEADALAEDVVAVVGLAGVGGEPEGGRGCGKGGGVVALGVDAPDGAHQLALEVLGGGGRPVVVLEAREETDHRGVGALGVDDRRRLAHGFGDRRNRFAVAWLHATPLPNLRRDENANKKWRRAEKTLLRRLIGPSAN